MIYDSIANHIKTINSTFTFKNRLPYLPKNTIGYNTGDIILVGEDTYVNFGGKWECVASYENNEATEDFELINLKCKCCGATLVKIGVRTYKCNYCDSVFENKKG